jgi:hypothetical protein
VDPLRAWPQELDKEELLLLDREVRLARSAVLDALGATYEDEDDPHQQ